MYKWLVVFMMAFIAVPAKASPSYIVGEAEANGGNAYEYLARIEKFRASKIRVMLPRECVSSCTLYTILLKYGLVCARPNAKLVFHQFMRQEVRTVDSFGNITSYYLNPPTKEQIRMTWRAYPAAVRQAMPQGLPEWGNEFTISARRLGIPNC